MVATSVASLLADHVRFELECIDRMYLNLYLPGLQTPGCLVGFLRQEPGVKVYSTNAIAPMTRAFVESIERFAQHHGVELIDFQKGQRKEEIALEYRRRFQAQEGVLFIGRAQEKTRVFRTIKRRDMRGVMPWIVMGTALPNHYYFYVLDRDFGRCSSNSAATSPMRRRSASTATSGSSGNWNNAASPFRLWTMACWSVPIRRARNRWPSSSTSARLRL